MYCRKTKVKICATGLNHIFFYHIKKRKLYTPIKTAFISFRVAGFWKYGERNIHNPKPRTVKPSNCRK